MTPLKKLTAAALLMVWGGPEAAAQDDETLAAARDVFARYQDACMADGGLLWGKSLCGPLLAYDQDTRTVYANVPDAEGRLARRDGVWVGTAEEDDAPPYSNTSAEWSGVRWATLRDLDLTDGPDPIRLALHESFHRIQPELALPYDDGPLSEHLDSFEGRVWMRLELRALTAALQTDDENASRGAVRDALLFRARRYRAFPDAAALERSLEYHEGLAEYTGWRLAESALTVADMVADLEAKETQTSFARSFPYATGPAMGLALDRIGLRWTPALRSPEATFLSIGAAAFVDNDPAAAADNDAVAAAAVYGYDALFVEETERAAETAARVAEYRTRFIDGPRLIVPLGSINFDPRTVTTLGDAGQVYGTLSVGGPWGKLSTTDGGLVVWANRTVVVAREDPVQTPAWTAERWDLELADGWTLKEDGDDLVLAPVD